MVEQVFLGMRITDQDYAKFPFISGEPPVKPVQGFMISQDTYKKVQILENNV